MDLDWAEITRIGFPPHGPMSLPSPVSTLAFDTSQELLWTGNDFGRVTSFCGTDLQRYTSFLAHPTSHGPVRQLLFNEKGVIALGPKNIHMAMRRGPAIWNVSHERMVDLHCMSFTSRGTSEIIVAGCQKSMFVIDLNKGEITKELHTDRHYKIMKKSRHICAATDKGAVDIIDPLTFQVLKTWQAHGGYINDMDAQNDFVVTCGTSPRQQGTIYGLDSFVNVFDLKNLVSMNPISFPPLAAYVRMHPRLFTTSIVLSQTGQIHIIDLMNPNTSNVKQANIFCFLNRIEISPTGEALALSDSDCYIHLWGSRGKIQFTELAIPVEFPQDEEPEPPMDWEEEMPLNTVGLPYYRETLMSAWPPLVSDVGAPPTRFDPGYLNSLEKWEHGMYGMNTRGVRRNQVENTRAAEKSSASIQPPKFLSEKSRESANASSSGSAPGGSAEEISDTLATAELESLKSDAPGMYRTVEIKFSKFGVDDFDFGYYNKSNYAGLENHHANSYANSLLQVLHFTPLIRNLALQHAASSCLDESCLLCELGFVFDMFQKAEGSTCQATNLLKTLNSLQQAHQLRLIEEENQNTPLTDMVQQLTRFVLGYIIKDSQRILPGSSDMERALATTGVMYMRCMNCRNETTRQVSTYVNELKYPTQQRNGPRSSRAAKVTFSQVLKSSIEQDSPSKGWCSRCQRYQTLTNRKTIAGVPAVLTLNASGQSSNNAEFRRLWSTPGWLPEEIGIIVDQTGQLFCYEGEDLKLHLQRGIHNIIVYSLIGMAVNVDNGQPHKPHLVAMVNVAHAEPTPPPESQWHLFNDFLVKPVSIREALNFNTAWKTPSVVVFQLKSENNRLDNSWKDSLDTTVLYTDQRPDFPGKTYRVLDPRHEQAGPDTIVALDTEFVAIKQPEIEMNADGERETIRPMIHALARVSVVRGQGEDEGLSFIDDYITIKESVVDYLTVFSGITKEDLDPRSSKHNLVPLKTAYKKLWVLLNLGCKFLGHGLRQDFRVINIQIPKAQIIDTIELFFVKARLRKLSLAFLAWAVLKEDIQLETHDSIEDARTALKLYRKYLEYEDAGILEPILQDIYAKGRETNFKPPRKEDQVIKRTDTPPIPIEGLPGPSTPSRSGVSGGGLGQPPITFGSKPSWTPGKGSPLR